MIKYCALTTIHGSMRTFVLPTLEKLKNNGYDVTIVCSMDQAFEDAIKGKYKYKKIDISRGFNLKTLKNIWSLYAFFRKEKFDMVQYATANVSLCASVAAFMTRIPVRIYEHWGARYIGLSGMGRMVCKAIEKTIAFFSTDIRQVSNGSMNLCIKDKVYSAEKAKVLGKGGTIGVDFNRFKLSLKDVNRNEIRIKHDIKSDEFVFGYVGSVRKDKGTNELLSAFKILLEKYDNIRLILNGDETEGDPINGELRTWAKNNEKIIFTGRVNNINEYMSAFDVLVHPSYREGFGMVLQEASAVKVPIIVSNIPGPTEFVYHNKTGLLAEKANVNDLCEKMEQLYLDSELRERLAESAYEQTAQYFNRETMTDRILEDRNRLYEIRIKK